MQYAMVNNRAIPQRGTFKMVTTEDSSTFGPWLRSERKRAGYTQRDIASLLGVSSRSISQWERGKQSPASYAQDWIRAHLGARLKGKLLLRLPNRSGNRHDRVPRPTRRSHSPIAQTEIEEGGLAAMKGSGAESASSLAPAPGPPPPIAERDLKFGESFS